MERLWQESQVVDISQTELASKLVSGFLALGGQFAKVAVRRLAIAMLYYAHCVNKSPSTAQTNILART